jgi:hypothetical protein
MTNALVLATTHGGTVPSPFTIVVALAAVSYILWSRTQGRVFNPRRTLVLPAVLIVIGVAGLTGSSAARLGPKDIAFLAMSVVISAVLGAARGRTIELFSRDGALWQRYTRWTVVLWIALIATKLILIGVASSAGASAGGGANTLLLTLGFSLLAEAATVGPRAVAAGMPVATTHAVSGRDRLAYPEVAAPLPIPGSDRLPARASAAALHGSDPLQPSLRHARTSRHHSGPAHRLIGHLLEGRTSRQSAAV